MKPLRQDFLLARLKPYSGLLSQLYGFLALLLIWQLLHVLSQSEAVPSPLAALINCGHLLTQPEIWKHLIYSLTRLLAAMAGSLVLGVSIGLLMGMNLWADKLLSPILYILFPIPKVALLPILFIFLGLGEATKVTLILLIVVFQITLMVRDTLRTVPKSIWLSAEALGLRGFALYRQVILPCTLKTVISSTRISIGTGIAVLFFAENYATAYGLGYFIMNSWSLIDYLNLYSGIVFLSLLGAALFAALDWLEKRYCHWHYA